jgi:hypothetical protein
MAMGHFYTGAIARKFVDQAVARDYFCFINDEIAPRVFAAGAASARVVLVKDEKDENLIVACHTQYTWAHKRDFDAYAAGVGKDIRTEVSWRFDGKVEIEFVRGTVTLEEKL